MTPCFDGFWKGCRPKFSHVRLGLIPRTLRLYLGLITVDGSRFRRTISKSAMLPWNMLEPNIIIIFTSLQFHLMILTVCNVTANGITCLSYSYMTSIAAPLVHRIALLWLLPWHSKKVRTYTKMWYPIAEHARGPKECGLAAEYSTST
jgi:hypothetical protein